jgi:fructose-1,6-bisphosphate aldolase class II
MFKKKNISILVNMEEMLVRAKRGKYAVVHFNINNLEWAKYILEECQDLKAPVILGVSEGAAKYTGGYNVITGMVKGLIKDLQITIPVALHLDHGSSIEACTKALEAGFSSVMLDASKYPLADNINMTKTVVSIANKYGASVEAEIGHIGGTEDGNSSEALYAKTDDCIMMARKTKITALAPALGSVHGLYKAEPSLDFTRMLEIGIKTDLPLVLHGGTGIPDDKLLQAIECGVCKINFNTELQIAWKRYVDNFISQNPNEYDPRKVIGAGERAIKAVVRTKVSLLKSDNKA